MCGGCARPPRWTDRASPGDLAYLAMDTGPVPEQLAAALVLDEELDPGDRPAAARAACPGRAADAAGALTPTPFGCGGPVWLDDPGLDLDGQVTEIACQAPGDEDALRPTTRSSWPSRPR